MIWLKLCSVIAAIVGLLVSLAAVQRRWRPHPEVVRKAMHVGSGLIALTLPSLFDRAWPVALLAMIASTGMFALKSVRGLRLGLGAVTGSVMRNTIGEICFPLGVGLIFVLADGDWLLYTIPILILTFADASAALIGVFYGVRRYTTDDGVKTLEGSLAFFQAAFLSTLTPLLLFTQLGRAETLMIALVMGVLSMLLDATAWWGLDNFLIPVLSFLGLRSFLGLELEQLILQFVLTMGLILFVIFWRKRTTLNDSAILSTVIYGYLCWTLGGWAWIAPPLVLLLSYTIISPHDVAQHERPYTVPVVLSVGAVGLFWLLLANASNSGALFYFPYVISFAAQLAMIGLARHRRALPLLHLPRLWARYTIYGWGLLLIPFLLIQPPSGQSWHYALIALVSVAVAVIAFSLSQSGVDGYRNNPARWLVQALSAALASVLGIAAVQGL
jgi:phytol kinase